jgi:hypothetical protein
VKLDLKRTSQADLEDRREVDYGGIIRKLIGGVLMVTVIGGLSLCFWPVKVPAVLRDATGSQTVTYKMRAIKQALMAGKAVTVDFSEAEVNGFLAGRAGAYQLKALAVDIKSGEMDVMALFSWRPGIVTNLTFLPENKVSIPVSLEMRVGFDQGRLETVMGRVGHLPLVGPLSDVTQPFFMKLIPDILAEKQLLGALAEVAFDQDVAHVKFGK